MRVFLDKALDCYDLVAEDVLVTVCLNGMSKDYRTHLENLKFPGTIEKDKIFLLLFL